MQQIDRIEKIRRWCAYQDRSHFETFNKLRAIGFNSTESNEIIADLISSNFLNEERFARSYARGKFRIKHWGKHKILFELRKHKIPESVIRLALAEISDEDYFEKVEGLFEKLAKMYKGNYHKIKQNLYAKGYEPEIIEDTFKRVNSKEIYAN